LFSSSERSAGPAFAGEGGQGNAHRGNSDGVDTIDSRGGWNFVEGEYWNAVSDTPIEKGEQAEIAAVQGLTVKLKTKGK